MWHILAIVMLTLTLGATTKWFTDSYLVAMVVATVIFAIGMYVRNNPPAIRDIADCDGL